LKQREVKKKTAVATTREAFEEHEQGIQQAFRREEPPQQGHLQTGYGALGDF
jgi:hypothetical protein